jgi:hypothetical protein
MFDSGRRLRNGLKDKQRRGMGKKREWSCELGEIIRNFKLDDDAKELCEERFRGKKKEKKEKRLKVIA